MPLPVAHALLGASVAVALHPAVSSGSRWKLLLLGAFVAVSPDFDYGLNWLRLFGGGGWHHGFTHSIVFAVLAGLVVAAVAGKFRIAEIAAYGAAILSHTLLDLLVTKSHGVALLSPFSDTRFKLMLPIPIDYTWRNSSLLDTATDLLRISLIEFAVFAPVLLVVLFIRKSATKRKTYE